MSTTISQRSPSPQVKHDAPERIGNRDQEAPAETPDPSIPAWAIGLDDELKHEGICDGVVALCSPVHDPDAGCQSTKLIFVRTDDDERITERIMGQLKMACQQCSRDGHPRRRRELSSGFDLYALPLHPGSMGTPVVGLIRDLDENVDTSYAIAQSVVYRLGQRQLTDLNQQERQIADAASAVNELTRLALAEPTFESAAQTIVSELDHYFGETQVLLGRTRSATSRCQLIAVSDVAKLDRGGEQSETIEDAFDEVILLDQPVSVLPSQATNHTPLAKLSRELNQSIVGIPISTTGGQNKLVVIVSGADPSTHETIERFLNALAPSLATIAEVFQRRPHVLSVDRWSQHLRKHSVVVAVTAIVVFTLAMFVPVTHRESCEAVVEPSTKRFVAIPFDATLMKCDVSPGDRVDKGQVLAVLEDRPLRWRLESLQADYEKAQKTKDTAQATHDYAKQRIAELDMQKAAIEIELLKHQLGELEVRSPIDGVIISGDHQRSQGVPVKTGDTLFEVAPLEEMTLEFSITEDQVRHVQPNQPVRMALDSLPNNRWEGEVLRISQRSEIRDGENVFVGETLLPEFDSAIRPGMRGTVSVECGRRALGWVLFHQPYESLTHRMW